MLVSLSSEIDTMEFDVTGLLYRGTWKLYNTINWKKKKHLKHWLTKSSTIFFRWYRRCFMAWNMSTSWSTFIFSQIQFTAVYSPLPIKPLLKSKLLYEALMKMCSLSVSQRTLKLFNLYMFRSLRIESNSLAVYNHGSIPSFLLPSFYLLYQVD